MTPHALLQAQALHALEWHILLTHLSTFAQSSLGAERCMALSLADTLAQARHRMQETHEMCVIEESEYPFPALTFQDLRDALNRIQKGDCWEAREFRDLSRILKLQKNIQQCMTAHRAEAPCLWSLIQPFQDESALQRHIDACIDEAGNMLDTASPELSHAFHEAHRLRSRLRHRVESMIASQRFMDVLQEQYFAVRDGRYVLPIKEERQSFVPGIVHDVSASGATVFLEPKELIGLNNELKVAEVRIAREIHRILLDLSGQVAERALASIHLVDILGNLDCILARARLSRRIEGNHVILNDRGDICLRQARHPLLVLGKDYVVANDVIMKEDQQILIISGPNTGGKTVNLKLVGIFALMVRGGLYPSCGPDSEMGFFPYVFADIGDAQDLTKDLSSFSAHILKIVHLLLFVSTIPNINSSKMLVLIDEIIGSTDPVEGAALAAALLHRFAGLGLKVIVTTHYNSLKTLAFEHPEFVNASLEFDVTTLTPTYRLIAGLPGCSSALDIAARLGMDHTILKQAHGYLHTKDRNLDQVFHDLHQIREKLNQEMEQARHYRLEAERATVEATEITLRLRTTEREEKKRMRQQFTEGLQRARLEIQRILDEFKQGPTRTKVHEIRKKLSDLEESVFQQIRSSEKTLPVSKLEAGARVEIGNLSREGILLESPQGKKRVRVRIGDSELSVTTSLLIGKPEEELSSASATRAETSSTTKKDSSDEKVQGKATFSLPFSLDLRGRPVDEALAGLIGSLDQAMLHGFHAICIIHGHGTGKLKSAVRHYLATSPYVKHFRPGNAGEGGDGVTIAELT